MRPILLLAVLCLGAPHARSAPVPKELRKPAQSSRTLTPIPTSIQSGGPTYIRVVDERSPEERRIPPKILKLILERLRAERDAEKKR